jgi:hypothetical protein
MSEHEEQELDLSDDKVVTKYKAAAEICNSELLKRLVDFLIASVALICAVPGQELSAINSSRNSRDICSPIAVP